MYEYKVVYKSLWKENQLEDILNEYAKEGYRVVNACHNIFHPDLRGNVMIVLEKEKKEEK